MNETTGNTNSIGSAATSSNIGASGSASQAAYQPPQNAAEQSGRSGTGESAPTGINPVVAPSSASPYIPKAAPVSQVKALHAWIIIILLALILAVSATGLVMDLMPTTITRNGAEFIPNQSFPSGQSGQGMPSLSGDQSTSGGTRLVPGPNTSSSPSSSTSSAASSAI